MEGNRTKTIPEEIEEAVQQMQNSARSKFTLIKKLDKYSTDSSSLSKEYGMGVRALGAIWINYILLSCYCHHKSNLLDPTAFEMAYLFHKKELKRKTGELFPKEDYLVVAQKMWDNPYKHLARMILILNMELERENDITIPDEIIENCR